MKWFKRISRWVVCPGYAGYVLLFLTLTILMAQFCSNGVFAEEEKQTVLLKSLSFWRTHETHRTPVVGTAADYKPMDVGRKGLHYASSVPAANWMALDFDDNEWRGGPGPFYAGHGIKQPRHVAQLCVRGRFQVIDPAAVRELAVSIEYRGGAIIYLNGKEMARQHLSDGALTPDTPAQAYPWEAYVKPDGKGLARGKDYKTFKDRFALRYRRLTVPIPSAQLKKGVNVLAIEIHRAPIHPDAGKIPQSWSIIWSSLGLNRMTLSAGKTDGLLIPDPNPKGLRVWNASPLSAVYDGHLVDPLEPLSPLRIVATCNGTFSGQVVVTCDQDIVGLKASIGVLTQTEGKATIPEQAVKIFYPRATGAESYAGMKGVRYHDALVSVPLERSPAVTRRGAKYAVQSVWVRVSVPIDATPGKYTAMLSITGNGKTLKAPVSVTVCPWKMPSPKTFRTFVDFIESPESVALAYDVPLWSKRHKELLRGVFRQLGRIGNKSLYLTPIGKTNLGNAQTIVRWIPGDDGTYTYDFSPLETYVKIAEEETGLMPMICLYIWDVFLEGGWGKKHQRDHVLVTALDPKTGKVSDLKLPRYTEAGGAEVWKPFGAALRAKFKAMGLTGRVMLGLKPDRGPSKALVAFWKEMLPGAKWVSHGHGVVGAIQGVPVGYCTTVWNARWAPDISKGYTYGWNRKGSIVAHNPRDLWRGSYQTRLRNSRLIGERNIQGKQRGFGRMSADFWALKNADGKSYSVSGLYQTWVQLQLRQTPYIAKGADGPISTVRFEMMMEGVQECEARIALETVLLDKAKSALLGEEKVKALRALLDVRIRVIQGAIYDAGWQTRSEQLFNAAEDVAQALK